ncbi:hypothetical protein B0H14DRAFT_2626289 [Mycena olivaceomarginata]|nr:hypothetical protein B0H14DRAFT_2626289 [Mycena olivaceomarginata]
MTPWSLAAATAGWLNSSGFGIGVLGGKGSGVRFGGGSGVTALGQLGWACERQVAAMAVAEARCRQRQGKHGETPLEPRGSLVPQLVHDKGHATRLVFADALILAYSSVFVLVVAWQSRKQVGLRRPGAAA